MGILKRQAENKIAKKGERRFQRTQKNLATADWGTVNPEVLRDTIATVALHGGALRLGYTSDGGAYAVGIYGDGPAAYTEYLRPDEEMEAFLHSIAEAFRDRTE